jgi:cytochrome c biogenesis protein CcmG/thiol:disulfide interchange protein DsbE
LRGKVLLLNFWATWCHGCKAEIPWFIEFQRAYQSRDFVVLGVSRDDDGWKAVRPYINAKKVNYRVMIGNDAVARVYGAAEMLPVTVLIDKSGRIAAKHAGVVSQSDCRAEIETLL